MMISFTGGEFVLGRGSINYQPVLDDFKNAKTVRILTYNISKKNYRNELINALKGVSEDADVVIISNIPSRMNYYSNTAAGDKYRKRYKESFTLYLNKLNPENFPSNPDVAFNFTNHAKIIGTENIVYVGSANYSDESKDNIESGTIIRDKGFIRKLYEEIFPAIYQESMPYFEDNFNVFRLFVISSLNKLQIWLKYFDDEIIWINPNTGIRGLYQNINLDKEDLEDLYNVIDEVSNFSSLIEDTYSETDDEYNDLIDEITGYIDAVDVNWMLNFIETDSQLYNFVIFDEEERTMKYIEDDPDAHDENLDTSIECAMEKAHDDYETMLFEIEPEIFTLRDNIARLIEILDDAHKRTLEFSDKWIADKVDNTEYNAMS